MARQTHIRIPPAPWARSVEQVLQGLQVEHDQGLGPREVKKRRRDYGLNRVRTKKRRSAWRILADQFKSIIALLLVAASLVSLIFDEQLDAAAIAAVVLVNGLIGFLTELRAVRSMEALAELSRVQSRVRRGGKTREIPADDLVPGDIVVIEAGDVVSADARLVQASKLQVDESALTGESVPVSKQTGTVGSESPLADRVDMLFKGTVVTRGSGEGVVVATGMSTELGKISALVEAAEKAATPLEKRLNLLGRKLIWATLGVVAVVSGAGVLAGKDVLLMIETGVALAVAAVPEGLPIVATVALAQGMWRMARRNALVNRLSAVETLGATSVIFTDKTGTLTQNRMTVTRLLLPSSAISVGTEREGGVFTRDEKSLEVDDEPQLKEALETGVLCNNAALGDGDSGTSGASGEPIEIALLAVGAKAGLHRPVLVEALPEEREEAFDPETKMMATFHRDGSGYRVAVKGAPESVIEGCSFIRTHEGRTEMTEDQRKAWLQRNREMAGQGLRILALATKTTQASGDQPYADLTFVGLIGMMDPPHEGVASALESCRNAGVRTIMVTGDHPGTAMSIARELRLVEAETAAVLEGKRLPATGELPKEERERIREVSIFARVNPKQKLDLVQIHQESRSIVAMTGDGVNDAPALKKADIGIAMGRRGTQVAREAADMVLKDDSFATIVAAIEQGRIIFGNIRKFALYLLSCNISEILVVGAAAVSSLPLPLLPIQILFLNLVTDVFPALALGVGKGDKAVMWHPPRPSEQPILTRADWFAVGGYGVFITGAVLGAFTFALTELRLDAAGAVTISFLTLAFAQLFHVFNMREPDAGVFRNEVTANPFVWAALVLCAGLLLLALYLPLVAEILSLSAPDNRGWATVGVMSLAPLVCVQGFRAARRANSAG